MACMKAIGEYMGTENLPRTMEMILRDDGFLVARIVDQRALPKALVFWDITTHIDMIEAIQVLALRGAPALGVGGAAALALYAHNESKAKTSVQLLAELEEIGSLVASARPTAVNLSWGVKRTLCAARRVAEAGQSTTALTKMLVREVDIMATEDEAANRAIGVRGAKLLAGGSRILTHCNAGSLATVFFGTALGVIYTAYDQGKIERVYVDETRPVGQGVRLTAWELARVGVPCTLICDNMAASVMAAGNIDAVIVGADRIARNGDTANKIGTYGLAVLAKHHGIPLYVAAPTSTIDVSLEDGTAIPVEERHCSEVAPWVPEGVAVFNPAFDVTPAELIAAIVTERGVFTPHEVAACSAI